MITVDVVVDVALVAVDVGHGVETVVEGVVGVVVEAIVDKVVEGLAVVEMSVVVISWQGAETSLVVGLSHSNGNCRVQAS